VGRKLISKIIALTAGLILLLIAYNHNQERLYLIKGEAYGTTWSIKSTEYIGDHHKDNIEKIISRIDYVASNYKEESEIALMKVSNDSYHFISEELSQILAIAKEGENISEGSYNITLGKVSSNAGSPPNGGKELIHKKEKTSNLNEREKSLEKLTLNGWESSSIAKGNAVQKGHEYLLQHNLNNHFIDIGGEIRRNGKNKEKPGLVGKQNPLS
jgi:Membrane-associated lipoprotein involved in thiamine biosynthesis